MGFLDDTKNQKIEDFIKFCAKELKLTKCPTIVIQNGKKNLKTTANYDYMNENKIIRVNGRNRATVDIMRSVAHEMVHHQQFEEGKLKEKPSDIGGEIEDSANAIAGQLIKKYAQIDSSIYED